MYKKQKTQVKNYKAIPGIIETIPADKAEELGAFIEHALTEKDAIEATEEIIEDKKEKDNNAK